MLTFFLINRKMPGFRHFAFTLFNYTEQHVATLRGLYNPDRDCPVRYVAFGYETCPTTGTPHLQGAIGFKRQMLRRRVKELIGSDTVHVEGARDILRNYAYAVKEALEGGEVEEYGERPTTARGERKDLEVAIEAVKNGMRLREFRSEFFGQYRNSTNAWMELIADNISPPEVEAHPLSRWQALLNAQLMHAPNPRTIIFLVDRNGNSGKSWFARYYHQIHGERCMIMQPARRLDMVFIFYKMTLEAERRVVFIDCKRSETDILDYRFLESLKDGWMQNGKYNSAMFCFEVPHVVVMMNEMPDMTKLSTDRYHVHSIDRGDTHHG